MSVLVRRKGRNRIEVECGGQKVSVELPADGGGKPEVTSPSGRSGGGGIQGSSGGPVVLGPLQPGGATARLWDRRYGPERSVVMVQLGAADYGDIKIAAGQIAGTLGELHTDSELMEVRLDWLSEETLDVERARGMISPHIPDKDFELVVVVRGKIING